MSLSKMVIFQRMDQERRIVGVADVAGAMMDLERCCRTAVGLVGTGVSFVAWRSYRSAVWEAGLEGGQRTHDAGLGNANAVSWC